MSATILVIDDDEAIAAMLAKILTRAGHDLVTASSAAEAEVAILTRPFDLVIVDKNLPGINGLVLVNRLRRIEAELPAILMTAYPEPILAPIARIQGYLAKPFPSIARVVEQVDRVLELSLEVKVAQARRQAGELGTRLADGD